MAPPVLVRLARTRDRVLRSAPASWLRAVARRLTPRRVRVRFAVLFGLLFIASGAVLLGMTYLLVNRPTHSSVVKYEINGDADRQPTIHIQPGGQGGDAPPPEFALDAQLRDQAARMHEAQMHDLLVQSCIALAIMACLSVVLSWLLARRVLRPMRTVTAGIRSISARNVHERLAVEGPGDEISDLADSVDGLLDRLEAALESHKRFVANAAHELRTPLTVERALLEECLLDPDATADSFRENFERLLRISTHQGALLESLLTLAVSERGMDRTEPVDLAEVVESVLLTQLPPDQRHGVRIVDRTEPAQVAGDTALLERLVANLVHNAAYYNVPDGTVDVTVRCHGRHALLTVTNTGPAVPEERVDQLFEPFQRMSRTAGDGHHGLGLSIVRAIAAAHDAALSARPGPHGGLVVELSFPLLVKDGERYEIWPQPRAATASK
ncbi:sensor histidine kinase [Streptomyces justiciae]|uniref:sensor histidine kinase n=1 Tax=Streptomyces justiciae TaxID=2780140 RepID=UPI002119215D|nr:HAMP domain-containing sensor histidine kinase [Streptomyces justiciae]MCW8375678.1 HAMP domain-containing histidine kinase [Streptomyces justiciae]